MVHILEDIGEFDKGGFGLVGFGYDQPVQGIKRVEKKMGIYLRFVHGQFCAVLLRFHFLTGEHLAEKFKGEFCCQPKTGYDEEKEPDALGM